MRERIESVADILLAAAHADHHVEPQELERIEAILREIWAQDPSPESLVRRVASFEEGEALPPDEVTRIGGILRELEPREDLPAHLVQRLADFDPGAFSMDEAVGPFLHESAPFKRRLLEMAVSVHESDGELDFAEDTFVRELGYKLGLEEAEFRDLLLEVFEPREEAAGAPAPAGPEPEPPIPARIPPYAGDAVDPAPPLTDEGHAASNGDGTTQGAAPEWSFAADLGEEASGEQKPGKAKAPKKAGPAVKAKATKKAAPAKAKAAKKKASPAAKKKATKKKAAKKKAAPTAKKKTAKAKTPKAKTAKKKTAKKKTAKKKAPAAKKKAAPKKAAKKPASKTKSAAKKTKKR